MSYNTVFYVQGSVDTVPASAAATGTIETVGTKVIGTGTLFKSQFQIYDCLYVAAKSEYRIVQNVVSDTEMTLDLAFTSDVVAGGTPKLINRFRATKIEVENVGAGTATIDGQDLATGTKACFDKQPYGASRAITDFISPIVLDASASDCQITILR